MTTIITNESFININGNSIPKNSFSISGIKDGARLRGMLIGTDLKYNEVTVDGDPVESVDDLITSLNQNSFKSGGGGGAMGPQGSVQRSNGAGVFVGDNKLSFDDLSGLLSVPGFVASNGLGSYAQAGSIYDDGEGNIFMSFGGGGSVASYLNLNVGGGLYKNSLKIDFEMSGLTASRIATFQDKDGVVAYKTETITSVERDAIVAPEEGLEIYNTDTHKKNFYNGTEWEEISSTPVV